MSINGLYLLKTELTGSGIVCQSFGSNDTTFQRVTKTCSDYTMDLSSSSSRACKMPIWISTSSRPVASGSTSAMFRTKHSLSPQPPPLPPPPPSPQLAPLKTRLARSKSISSRSNSRLEYVKSLRKVSDGEVDSVRLRKASQWNSQTDYDNEISKELSCKKFYNLYIYYYTSY